MKSVLVSWTVQPTPMAPGTKAPHHFRLGLALQEVDIPLDAASHLFSNVEVGTMAGFITVCAEDGTELAPPLQYSVEVLADVMVPVPASIGGVVQ